MHSVTLVASVLVVIVAVVLPLLVSYFFGGRVALYISPPYGFNDIPDLTGSNTGIGYVTARELARKGARVIVAARNVQKGNEAVEKLKSEIGNLPGASLLEFMQLDLSSLADVQKFAKQFNNKRLALDMLILNAGVMAPDYGLTTDGFETQIGTNHIGHFLLVKLLNQVIKASKARVVHVSSLANHYSYPEGIRFDSFSSDSGYDAIKAYGQSKLANVLFSNELAKHLKGTGATSNSLHPGIIKTELARHLEGNVDKYPFMKTLLAPLGYLFECAQLSVDGGALTQLYVATSPQLEGVSGAYYVPIAIEAGIAAHAQNMTMQLELWDVSERLTKPFW